MLRKIILSSVTAALILTLTACNSPLASNKASETPESAPTTAASEIPSNIGQAEDTENDPEPEPTAHVEPLRPELLPQLLPMSEGEDIAVLTTSEGVIKIRFFPQFAPKAVDNFIGLVNKSYYKDMIFHRVIDGFVIQTGDPLGTGAGGASIWGSGFEIEPSSYLHHIRGALGMARSPQDYSSNGSQFYIVQNNKVDSETEGALQEYKANQDVEISGTDAHLRDFFPEAILDKYLQEGGTPALDFDYTVFGQVYEGMDIVDKIAAVKTTEDKPDVDVKLISVEMQKYTK